VLRGLQETGVFSRLSEHTKRLFTVSQYYGDNTGRFEKYAKQADETFLQKVEGHLPAAKWPRGMHREIAEQLGVNPKAVSAAISYLLATGRASNPNPDTSSRGENSTALAGDKALIAAAPQ
jgi:hypothetical protein